MARRMQEDDLEKIVAIVRNRSGIRSPEIALELGSGAKYRTVQYRLKRLVEAGRLQREGDDRWARYRMAEPSSVYHTADESEIPLSSEARHILVELRKPLAARRPVGYDQTFLRQYTPNETSYIPVELRDRLHEQGAQPALAQQQAGTFVRQIVNRLLVDLSWNSSRLEGNTYSLLETRRLIEFGREAEGRSRIEAQMILNHKDAVEFLVSNALNIAPKRGTILNLHAILAQGLLVDPGAAGRLRHIPVGIEGSVYYPPENPQLIQECFDDVLDKAHAIIDPFEQALFLMVHLPYLQPFDDVNKRVSRMAANIPFITANLAPLAFTDVPRDLYTLAMLGVYELNRVELLRDVFAWSYERSAMRYKVLRQTIGEPDPLRLRYRDEIKTIVRKIIRAGMNRLQAADAVEAFATEHAEPPDQEALRDIIETELLSLHEGNFARYMVSPDEFETWDRVWRK